MKIRSLGAHAALCILIAATPVVSNASFFGLFGSKKSADIPTEAADDDEGQAGPPTALEGEEATDSDVEVGEAPPAFEISPQGPATGRQPWKKPDFSAQEGVLGYDAATFQVPAGFEERVAFWVSIYSKYTTSQGVLHDAVHLNVVYEPIDFNEMPGGVAASHRRHGREHFIKEKKHAIEERLLRLDKLKSGDSLTGEDLRYWKMFEKVPGEHKFADAARRGRMRFQLGQRDRFALGIYYSGRYLREMEKIFRDEKMPIELTRLPFVESSFNIYARSKVGASGIWQFMRRTARPYMMVNPAVDERNDPIRATHSAAKVLKSNFELLGSWPLALTGWNHGPNGVLRITKKTGSKDLVKIVSVYSSKHFGFASENFYACFLAALEVEKHARKYFGDVKWSAPLDHAEVRLSNATPYEAVRVWFGNDDELAQLYNPHFSAGVRRGRQNMPRGTNVRIPKVMLPFATDYLSGKLNLAKMRTEIAAAKIDVTALTLIAANAPLMAALPVPSPTIAPATISAIGTPAPTPSPAMTVSPSITPVPSASPVAPVNAPATVNASSTPGVRPTAYTVVEGDSIDKIAASFGLTRAELKAANKRKIRGTTVRLGQVLKIPAMGESESEIVVKESPTPMPVASPAPSPVVTASPTATP